MLLGVVSLAASCRVVSTEADPSPNTARDRWTSNHPASYDFTMRRLCFCPAEFTNPVIVAVRNGVVESRRYESSGQPLPANYAQSFPTIDGLWEIVDDAARRNAAKLDVTYDPVLGYPTRIDIDYDTRLADEEVTIVVTRFAPR